MDDAVVIPKEIGGYKITGILGEGGMSVVYTATQKHPERTVAIKVLRNGLYSPTASKRFHLEVEILGKLDHPWIAKIFDAGTHDDGNGATPYYVMEHVENARELTEFLEDEKPNRRELLKLFTMITSAVEHGHHRGIVHRDIKPGNILIDSRGEPKLIDFGVARSLSSDKVNEQAMTEAGRLVGTVQFMAPEQVDAKISDVDARCDVYALGAVLYQMLTTRLPRTLEGLPIYEAVRQICKEDPVLPTIYDDTIDQDLEAIIMKAIENDRGKRYQTAGAFGRDMLRYLGDIPIKARKVTALDRTRLFCRRHKKQFLIWGIVFCVGAVAATGGLIFKKMSDDRQEELQTTIEELSKQNEELATVPAPSVPEEALPAEPIFVLQSAPEKLQVSSGGSVLIAVIEDEFVAYELNGIAVALPSMNIEPIEAVFALSTSGTQAVFVSKNAYVVQLGLTPPTKEIVEISETSRMVSIENNVLASISPNGVLEVLSDGNKLKPATSTTGDFNLVTIDSRGEQIYAATDNWIYVWDVEDFPKNATKLNGVVDPMFIGSSQQKIVVADQNGKLLVYALHSPQSISKLKTTIQLETTILQCALNRDATEFAYVSGATAFVCNVETGESEEVTWMPNMPIGVAYNANNSLILWTAEGEFYQSEK
ncbi:MAG TPA: serine/threonine protein kinase [Phycisphaerales bacterium]|nr:serine/threonine protein kinase [Phycisphaerales bacterium]HIB50273.1 serine/threonine protein kinase [Phycisphaerales bacterium]HIN83475.1 serine/threonine protein kinase [Phycisphaerales bacterium]HIO19492.1 serine/threonine protein kinase [Phycisphaerales bacterium]HIO52691.1 serine/threonine protein kinase [Phycisphaerales bacterium]